ncbi:MAG TPA: NAD-dependent epimerase/dehydratase family protein [Bacillota bacterium]|nr:NAD-dependent epimerase/dehydratase family protein [Bacillota bacterium]HPJ85326.1 NAD-dependent epimerase/dehydratase family protein [Bacillota bacterium]HPQ61378.1 NAD-dependent epimerase/dehydratase family protein [Bacillota bacterium]
MIYLTGATGRLGNNIARYLQNEGIPFTILLRKNGKALLDLNDVKYVFGDIFDPVFLSNNISENDTLIHSAGFIDLNNHHKKECDSANYLGTEQIIDFCQKSKVRLIYISTVDCIPREKSQGFISEPESLDVDNEGSNYTVSKGKATAYLLEKMKNEKMPAVILYPSAIIGINDFKPSALGKEIRKAMRRRISFYFRGGYNFIDVRDCAKAVVECVKNNQSGCYIMAANNRSVKQLLKEVGKVQNHKVFLIGVPVFLVRTFSFLIPDISDFMIDTMTDNYNYDNSLMLRDLVPEPFTFEKTVDDTVKWFSENEHIFE